MSSDDTKQQQQQEQPKQKQKIFRVGFVAATGIAKKTWGAIALGQQNPDINTEGIKIVVSAVAARDKKKAQTFIDELQSCDGGRIKFESSPVAFGSYEELLGSGVVDAVYIANPMTLRYDIIHKAISAGLHVVSEKPLAHDFSIVDGFFSAAANKHVCFIDGTMLSHSKRIEHVREQLKGEKVVSATATFTFPGGDCMTSSDPDVQDIRVKPALEPLGALGDIGHYCVRFAVEALVGRITGVRRCCGHHVVTHPTTRVSTTFAGMVEFDILDRCGASSVFVLNFYCSMNEAHQQHVTFRSQSNSLTVEDFCLPFSPAETTKFSIQEHSIGNVNPEQPYLTDHIEKKVDIFVQEAGNFQEQNLWANLAKMASGHDAAVAKKPLFEKATRLTSQVLALLFKSANEGGSWIGSSVAAAPAAVVEAEQKK